MITLTKKHIQGMSLVELLVAITIGALLLVGATSLLINNKRVYKAQNEIGRVQENARFAIERLLNDISMSGYFGCSGDPTLVTNNIDLTKSGDLYDLSNYLEGFDNAANTWQPSGDATGITAVAGTDGITIRNMNGTTYKLQTPLVENESDDVYVDVSSGIKENDYVVISDCKGADVFRVTTLTEIDDSPADGTTDKLRLAHAATENISANLGNKYRDSNAESAKFSTSRYYIDDTGNKGPALFRNGEELVEGVSDMQLLYGVNTDGDADATADSYFTAAAVTAANWPNVVSVKVTLTFNIIDRDYTDVTPTPWVYTTTVRIRNNSI